MTPDSTPKTLLTLRQRVAFAASQTHRAPTVPQRQAGNYPKGKFPWNGHEIAIETPKGGIRTGQDRAGRTWKVTMPAHYGYIRRTLSDADGDAVDVIVGPHPESDLVCVVDQVTAGGRFDEHKAVIGCLNVREAKELYLACYSSGWKGFRSITPMTRQQFSLWLKKGDTGRPIMTQVTKKYSRRAELAAAKYALSQGNGKSDERWITIHPHGHEEGTGTPVKIDGQGRIVGGPKGIADKGIKKLSDFGGKGKDTKSEDGSGKSEEKKDGRFTVKGNEIYDSNGVRHGAFRNAEKAQAAADEWNREGKPGEENQPVPVSSGKDLRNLINGGPTKRVPQTELQKAKSEANKLANSQDEPMRKALNSPDDATSQRTKEFLASELNNNRGGKMLHQMTLDEVAAENGTTAEKMKSAHEGERNGELLRDWQRSVKTAKDLGLKTGDDSSQSSPPSRADVAAAKVAQSPSSTDAQGTQQQANAAPPIASSGNDPHAAIKAETEFAKSLGYDVKLINKKPSKWYGKHLPGTKTIEVYTQGRTPEQIQDTLTHEVGHIADYDRRGIAASPMGDSIRDQHTGEMRAARDGDIYFRGMEGGRHEEAKKIREELPRKDSAAGTQKEIYADAYRLFRKNPERLKEIAPKIFGDISGYVNGKGNAAAKVDSGKAGPVTASHPIADDSGEDWDSERLRGNPHLMTPAQRAARAAYYDEQQRATEQHEEKMRQHEAAKKSEPVASSEKTPSFGDSWQKHRDSGKNDFNATLHALSDHLKSKGVDVSPNEINAHWSNHYIDSLKGNASEDRIKAAFEQSRDVSKDPTDLWWMNQGLSNLPGANGATQREPDMERRRKNLEGIASQYMKDAELLTGLGSDKGAKLKAKAESILKSVESNRKAFQKAIALEKAQTEQEESAAREKRRWRPEQNTAKPMTPKQLAKAFDGPRHAFAKMLSETGWYSNGAIAVKPPEKLKQQILSQSTIHDGRYPNIDDLASQESSNRNSPMKTIGHRALEIPGKKGKIDSTNETLLADDSGNHVSVDSAYLQTIQKMYPNATFHAPQRLHGPIAVKDGGNVVGLLMSRRGDDVDKETEDHVREATGSKKVKRYSRRATLAAARYSMAHHTQPNPSRIRHESAK